MASFTMSQVTDLWPEGTTVGAYALNGLDQRASVASSSVAVTNGAVAFTGLAELTRYEAYALTKGRKFQTQADPATQDGSTGIVFGDPGVTEPPAEVSATAIWAERNAAGEIVALHPPETT